MASQINWSKFDDSERSEGLEESMISLTCDQKAQYMQKMLEYEDSMNTTDSHFVDKIRWTREWCYRRAASPCENFACWLLSAERSWVDVNKDETTPSK